MVVTSVVAIIEKGKTRVLHVYRGRSIRTLEHAPNNALSLLRVG